jgi:hypothetical protein
MKKPEAINCLEKLGLCFPDEKLLYFASPSSAKKVWWIDIPCGRMTDTIDKQLSLILHEPEGKKIHHLIIPTKFVHCNSNLFTRRYKSGVEYFSIELSMSDFIDIRPNGSQLSFESFKHGAFEIN